jgi:hypothetical protein
MSQPLATSATRCARSSTRWTASAFLRQCRKRATEDPRLNQCTSHPPHLIRSSRTTRNHYTPVSRPFLAFPGPQRARARPFSTTQPSCATVVAHNPRVDEDGKNMTIEISPRAAKVCSELFHKFPRKVVALGWRLGGTVEACACAIKQLQQFDQWHCLNLLAYICLFDDLLRNRP